MGCIHKGLFVLAIPVSCFQNTCFIVSASGRDCPDITGKQRVSFQHHQLSIFFISSPSSASPSPFPLPFTSLSKFDAAAAAAAKSFQSCLTLCDPIDWSPLGSPVPGILQARTLEWVAISFSNAWKWKVKVKSLSRVRLFTTPGTEAYQAPLSMGFSRQEYWSGVPLPSPLSKFGDRQTLHFSEKEEESPLPWASGTSCIKIRYQVKTQ